MDLIVYVLLKEGFVKLYKTSESLPYPGIYVAGTDFEIDFETEIPDNVFEVSRRFYDFKKCYRTNDLFNIKLQLPEECQNL